MKRIAKIPALAAIVITLSVQGALAQSQLARGKYLTTIMGCTDCHTPGHLFGRPDMKRYLGGSNVGFAVPGLGVFVPPNLTPDKKTGLGDWTAQQIVTALRTGERPDGRILARIMPWEDFAALSMSDATAIAVYLKSLPPVRHRVPGPFGPGQKPNRLVMNMVPASVHMHLYMHLPKPQKSNAK